jgi:carbamoylphosphate synthase small subunit
MALAAGMKTAKLKYGNRGHNQVCALNKHVGMYDDSYFGIFSHVY